MPLDGAHERLRMLHVERMEQEAIERGGKQCGSAEPEGEQQHHGEVGRTVVSCEQGLEDACHAASNRSGLRVQAKDIAAIR
jgi:hypothetical protein